MLKKVIFGALLIILSVGALGCPAASTSLSANVKTVREAEIAPDWAMKQMEITLEAETKIVLTLAYGDKVDGYFYLESGDNISFSISGTSLIYESKASGTAEKNVSSDRFSFTASQAQGIAYTLKLNPGSQETSSATVLIELIYPATGEIFIPIGTK